MGQDYETRRRYQHRAPQQLQPAFEVTARKARRYPRQHDKYPGEKRLHYIKSQVVNRPDREIPTHHQIKTAVVSDNEDDTKTPQGVEKLNTLTH
jgi:hypothetical protein